MLLKIFLKKIITPTLELFVVLKKVMKNELNLKKILIFLCVTIMLLLSFILLIQMVTYLSEKLFIKVYCDNNNSASSCFWYYKTTHFVYKLWLKLKHYFIPAAVTPPTTPLNTPSALSNSTHNDNPTVDTIVTTNQAVNVPRYVPGWLLGPIGRYLYNSVAPQNVPRAGEQARDQEEKRCE
jgi:hypothetical protein